MEITINEERLRKNIRLNLLNENSLDRKANKLIANKYGLTDFDEIRRVRATFLNRIPNARTRNGKWLYQILQWYLNGEIPNNETKKLNKFLGWLSRNKCPVTEIETDWNTIGFRQVKEVYDTILPKANEINISPTPKVQSINGFTIRRVDDMEDAQDVGYRIYDGEWCIFDNQFDNQVSDCTCYIITNNQTYPATKPIGLSQILKKLDKLGCNEIIEDIEEGLDYYSDISEWPDEYFKIASPVNGLLPYDEYGLSAILILVGPDGNLYGVFSRYNIPSSTADGDILDKRGLSDLIGADISKTCPYVERNDTTNKCHLKNLR